MKGALLQLGLLVLCAAAVWLREAPAPGHRRAPAGEAAVAEPRWLVDDPDAAYHLRRVQLALATGAVPSRDSFLNHPHGSAVPWPPFLDGLLATAARVLLATDAGDPALGGVDEARLEAFLVHAPPWIGGLATLAVFWAASAFVRNKAAAPWAGLAAAALYAFLPVAVWYGGVTRLDHHVFVGLFLAAHLALLGHALVAEELTDVTLSALLAGLVAGFSLLSWLASAVFIAAAGVAWAWRALATDPAAARDGARGGMLYFLAAAACTLIPASESAWNAVQPGSLINLTEGVPRALFAAALPFALGAFLLSRGVGTALRAGAMVAVTAVAVLVLPGFLAGAREGFAWASRANLFMDVVAESRPLLDPLDGIGWMGAVRDLSPAVLLFPLAWLCGWRAWRRADRVLLLLTGGLLAAMTLTQRRFGNALAVPMALTLGVVFAEGLAASAAWRRRTAAALLGLVALAAVPAAWGSLNVPAAEYEALRAWRGELIDGLRWMREETVLESPWNAPSAAQDWGVLSGWGLGHLIEYHARRPTVTTNFGAFVGEEGFRGAARLLLEEDPARLIAGMRSLRTRYLVVTPRLGADFLSVARVAALTPEERAAFFVRTPQGKRLGARAQRAFLYRLALYDPADPPVPPLGLERVYASSQVETADGRRPRRGEAFGPVISIYRIDPALPREPPKLGG